MANKIQRRVNRNLRPFRRVLREDSYLQNRFYLHQIKSDRDKEEGIMYFQFEIEDIKTGEKKESHWYNEYELSKSIPRDLFSMCNNFIALTLLKDKKT